MKFLGNFFFYTYVGLVVVAGAWGAFGNANLDFRMLFRLDADMLGDYSRINLLSQYRFLRAIELGFGIFSIVFKKDIFSDPRFNRLFLFIMGAGVASRMVSVWAEGNPSPLMWFFMIYEFAGLLLISLYTKINIYDRRQYIS
ncbi:protein of unknown function [Pedobacter westerhofensis]|uniref:DUF4345 domain-containing protein n=1 Tax=Pedobacter westerhofensis TaxID=425512 RepID=A0A521CTV2_9SPHI|nr:DUF4345 family protein [Pedobacter westerhofensis]SMO62843.1 protein of unknown function [Pedobacter westerhofensis]